MIWRYEPPNYEWLIKEILQQRKEIEQLQQENATLVKEIERQAQIIKSFETGEMRIGEKYDTKHE